MIKRMYSILTCLTCLSLAPGLIMAKIYQAPFDQSKWKMQGNRLECTLSHSIPNYGIATFQTKAGERQTFDLQTTIVQFKAEKAKIVDAPPRWKTSRSDSPKKKVLATLPVKASTQPIRLTKMTSYEMLDALANGREPYIRIEKKGQKSADQVVLSSTGFKMGYSKYMACIEDLVAYNYDTIKKSTFFFNSGSLALPEEAKKKLDAVIEFVNHDEDVYRVDLTGHSDSKGGYLINRKLANQRMWAIKDYMVMEGGVNPNIFTLKGYSDRKPIASNKTKEGRAKNRRVELKLYR